MVRSLLRRRRKHRKFRTVVADSARYATQPYFFGEPKAPKDRPVNRRGKVRRFTMRWWVLTFFPLIVDNLIRVAALIFVPRNRRPSAAMAWLLAFFAAPVPASGYFALVGGKTLPKKRRERHQIMVDAIEAVAEREEATFEIVHEDRSQGLENAVKIGRALGAQPMLGGNKAWLLPDYDETMREIAAAIDGAQDYVHMEFYLMALDDTTRPVFEAMERATQRGVRVMVLLDHVTSVRAAYYKETQRALTDMGAQWQYMLPFRPLTGQWQRPDLRNHRKIVVVDGDVGFMGSQNMVAANYNKKSNIRRGLYWKDLMVKVKGPAVLGLDAVFQGDWFSETGEVLPNATELELKTEPGGNVEAQILPSGPGFATENNLQVFVALMYTAVKRISITSPYFIPDGGLLHALKSATARGVEVELFVSEIGDQPMVFHAQRSYYEELLKADVRIYLYKPPVILHSKHFTIDDDVAVIGSSNMDQRSFNLNEEVSMIVHSSDFVTELDRVVDDYREHSRELTLEEWSKQPFVKQVVDGLARLTSSLQ